MQPKSNIAFAFCIFLALGAGSLLIARLIGWIHVNWVVIVFACIFGGGSAFMIFKEYFRKPFVKEFGHSDWTVLDPFDRKKVFIKIPSSEHGAGNKPRYSFENRGFTYETAFDVIDDGGDLTIYHPDHRFMNIYSSFVIRIV